MLAQQIPKEHHLSRDAVRVYAVVLAASGDKLSQTTCENYDSEVCTCPQCQPLCAKQQYVRLTRPCGPLENEADVLRYAFDGAPLFVVQAVFTNPKGA